MDAAAFPNPWENGKDKGGKGRKGQQGGQDGDEKGGQGDRKGDRRGGKGGGKGGKDPGDEESLPSKRKDQLEAELVALSCGTESSAIPRVGDLVQVTTVMGSDPQQLQGKTGRVIGIALLPSLKNSGGAVSIRLDADAGGAGDLDVSVAASDIRILEAVRPLPEGSLTFPKTLTGLERKFVHSVAERIGLISQSFGKGQDRYITAYRAAEGSGTSGCQDSLESTTSVRTTKNIDASGVELDTESKAALLEAMTIPEGWAVSADRMVICRGSFQKPKQMDHRSVVSDLLGQICTLRAGNTCSLRVVTVARGEHALAVGVLGVPSVDRNPHVLIASDHGPQSVKDLDWRPWEKEALLLKGQLKEWSKDRPEANGVNGTGATQDEDQVHPFRGPETQPG